MEQEEEVWCECSDEEKYNPGKAKKGSWEPTTEDILKLYEELKTNKVLELNWKCPGRRSPGSDKPEEGEQPKEQEEVKDDKEEEKKPLEPTEFDFDDAFETAAVITPRRLPGSTPKPQKKVASMQKVLQEMVQKKKEAAAEKEARKQLKSARALGSPARARLGGSPIGSPRTPPASMANRQSPVRLPGVGDTLQIKTPVRGQLPGTPLTPVTSTMETPPVALIDTPTGPQRVKDVQTPVASAGTPKVVGQLDTNITAETMATVKKIESDTPHDKSEPDKMDSSTTS